MISRFGLRQRAGIARDRPGGDNPYGDTRAQITGLVRRGIWSIQRSIPRGGQRTQQARHTLAKRGFMASG